MKPLDPRLLKYAKSTRRFIVEIAALGLLTAALVIAQAFLISYSVSPVVTRGASPQSVLPTIGLLAVVVTLRALTIYFREARAHRAADQAIDQLRTEVTRKAVRLGPRWRARHATETATLLTRGLDDLEPYFVKFLPQLLLVMTVTPLALASILFLDFWSALIALIVIPLIPLFMVLVGKMTQGFSQKKLIAMERLGAQLLDLLTGLPTLRALGREKGPREHLIRLSKQNTHTTMQTLRVAFLSGGVLEFLATLSVALVAVQVGMRMVTGEVPLSVGLVIIMLAPEVFEPLRQVGAQFHASTNGVAAAEECFAILEEPEAPRGDLVPSPAGQTPIRIENLSVAARGAWAPHDLNGTIEPSKLTVLVGASGAGKSTTVQVLLGFEGATRGMITAQDEDGKYVSVSQFRPKSWWEHISWIPQHPTIIPGTVLSNVLGHNDEDDGQASASDRSARVEGGAATGATQPDEAARADEATQARAQVIPAEVLAAAKATGFNDVVATLPQGWNTTIGFGGVGLSVGQRQRLALTRTLVRRPGLLILDEPTAHLDAVSENQVVSVLENLTQSGSTVLVIAHRNAVVKAADTVIEVNTAPASAKDIEDFPQLLDEHELMDLSGSLPELLDPSSLRAVSDNPDVELEVKP